MSPFGGAPTHARDLTLASLEAMGASSGTVTSGRNSFMPGAAQSPVARFGRRARGRCTPGPITKALAASQNHADRKAVGASFKHSTHRAAVASSLDFAK